MKESMLLRNTTFVELAEILEKHKDKCSISFLKDKKHIQQAKKTAKANGVWNNITKNFNPNKEIPVIKRSAYRNYIRNGNRTIHQDAEHARVSELNLASLALWLDHPSANIDYLQDLLWAYCDDWTWVMAAHEYGTIDLGSATLANRFAELLNIFEDKLEPEVINRMRSEIKRRLFDNYWDPSHTEFWHTARMNWNHVCNGAYIRTAMLEMKNSRELARAIHPAIQNMTYALDGFTDDGGCEEGAGYWNYGFGNFVQAAAAVYLRTGSEVNLMEGEKIKKICQYPIAAHIEHEFKSPFADSGQGPLQLQNVLLINKFMKIPELYELCTRQNNKKVRGAGLLYATDMHTLALYENQKATGKVNNSDACLNHLGVVKARSKKSKKQLTVMAIASNNGVPHNHNDIGSFVVYSNGKMLLTDPGSPLYKNGTFNDKIRYKILYCRSRGHSVPVINGKEQSYGKEHKGYLSAKGLNSKGTKKINIEFSEAYPKGTVSTLTRKLNLDYEQHSLEIDDQFIFSRKPKSIEEAFVTFESVKVIKKGRAVNIAGIIILEANQTGSFTVSALKEESYDSKPDGRVLNRVVFTPKTLNKNMSLSFKLTQKE